MKTYKKDSKIYEIQIVANEKENLEKVLELGFKILKDGGNMVIISLVDYFQM